MRFQVQHTVLPQLHFLLNHIAHSFGFTIARTSETQVQPEAHLLAQFLVHPFVHLYIDLQVHF